MGRRPRARPRSTSPAKAHRRPRASLGVAAFAVLVGAGALLVAVVAVSLAIASRQLGDGSASSGAVPSHSPATRPATNPATSSRPSTTTSTSTGRSTSPRTSPRTSTSVSTSTSRQTAQSGQKWINVLRVIDRHREAAWRLGRPDLLAQVYVGGSTALRADRAMLAGYVHRGWRVAGVSLRFRSVAVVSRHPSSVRLVVVDRLGPSVALGSRGRRETLPADRASRHRIELRRVGPTWRIAYVTAA